MAAPRSRPRWLSGLAVVAVGVAVGWLGWSLLTPAPGSDRRLPELTLERLEGGELPLASLAGQPLVVNLWATWCLPCLRELPLLAEHARANPDVRFVFVDQGEAREAVAAYLAERPELELGTVALDRDLALSLEFDLLGLPNTLFFDARGRLVRTHVGEVLEADLVAYLAALQE
ncbi:MAG: TlpA family protein disulfide reductase [Deinococcales bacterium]|mgnify:CR=1 FL=1|nr:TlpA family protein disulfide reductase [Deinococcales bacterium]